jgi:hypothetical protein
MRSPRYWWCHTGGHDKVYAVFYNPGNDGGVAIWGRRGGSLKSTPYDGSKLADKVSERRGKDYEEITGSESATTRRIVDQCNSAKGFKPTAAPAPIPAPAPVAPPKPAAPQYTQDNPGVVICVENIGMDGQFTKGVDYLLKGIPDNAFYLVEDMFGKDQKVLQSRFKIQNVRPVLV